MKLKVTAGLAWRGKRGVQGRTMLSNHLMSFASGSARSRPVLRNLESARAERVRTRSSVSDGCDCRSRSLPAQDRALRVYASTHRWGCRTFSRGSPSSRTQPETRRGTAGNPPWWGSTANKRRWDATVSSGCRSGARAALTCFSGPQNGLVRQEQWSQAEITPRRSTR